MVPWQVLIATGILVMLAALFEGRLRIDWNEHLIELLIYGGVVGIAVPYWATVTVNRSLPAVTTSVGLLGVPVVGVLCSVIALGEPVSYALITALAIIMAGIVIGTKRA